MVEGGKRKARPEQAPAPPSHRILTSDELGLLKVSEVPSGNKWEETSAKQRWGQPDKQHGITCLQVHCPDWDQDCVLIAAAHCGGRVTLHCPLSRLPSSSSVAAGQSESGALGATQVGSFRAAAPATTSGRSLTSGHELRGLRFVSTSAGAQQLRLVTATAGGHVAVHGWESSAAADDGGGDGGARCGGNGGDGSDDGGDGEGEMVRTWKQQQQQRAAAAGGSWRGQWREVVRIQTVSDVQDMDVSSNGQHVAVGGDGHQLRVWDLAATAASASAGSSSTAPEPLFAGKAGKPSRSGLQDLAHVTAVSYVPGRDDQLVLVGTAKHKLWLYDMRAGRKPQSELVWGEGRITALLPQPDGLRVWAGNGRGQVEALDLRQAPSRVTMGHALKGSAGSIRALSLHPTQPLIASVSLDRHLRVHSTTNHQLLTRIYLKQALTGVAWLPIPENPNAKLYGEEQEDEDVHDGHENGEDGNEEEEGLNDGDEAEDEEGGRVERRRRQAAPGGGKGSQKGAVDNSHRGGKKGKSKEGAGKGTGTDKGKDSGKKKDQKRRRREGAVEN